MLAELIVGTKNNVLQFDFREQFFFSLNMWLLKKLTPDVTVDVPIQYLISEKKCYTVGRKNCDIVLNDPSISRNHCVINIAPKRECPFTVQTHTGVWVIDKSSKYGTYVQKNYEWVRLDKEKVEELPDGIIIRFGLMENIWRLEYKPVIVCTSRLSVGQTQDLKSQLTAVDGIFLSKWANQCTIVIVNDITLTIKVLLALIHGVPIVSRDYLNQMTENVKKNHPLPDCNQYKPEIRESTLISHLVSLNSNRRELFKGKTFVIPGKEQLENLREIIEAAGGCIELLKIDGNWRKLSDENTIVVQLPCNRIINPDQNAQDFKNLTNILKNEYHVRVVPETEIYHAIAYSSVEKYCNPRSQAFELRHSSYYQNSYGDVIEEETPSESHIGEQFQVPTTSGTKEQNLLTCSTSEKDATTSRKRNHSPEFEEKSKRAAIDISVKNINSMDFSDDNDLFCEILQDEKANQVEKVAKEGGISNLKNLSITKRNSVEEGADDHSKKNSSNGSSMNYDYELGGFWDYDPEKVMRNEGEKRKLIRNSTEENQADPPGKRKRIDIVAKTSESADSLGGKLNTSRDKSGLVSRTSEKIVNRTEHPKCIRVGGTGNELIWYLRKNGGKSNRESEHSDEEIVINVKTFKKKEMFIPDTTASHSKESVKEIGKALLMQGWRMSQCSRRRNSVDA